MSTTQRRRVVIAIVLAGVCARTVEADYKRAYYEGYQLARQGRSWEIVAQKMTEAIKENDREGEQIVLTSANTQPYLPHFYLGLARFQLGDCRGARENWIKSSVQKKVVLHGREREWFNQYAPICELVVPIEDAFKQADSRLQTINELAQDGDLRKVWMQDAAFEPTLTKLRQQFGGARESFRQARAARLEHQQSLLLSLKADATQLAEQIEMLFKSARARRDDLVARRLANEKRLADEKKNAPESAIAANSRAPEPAPPGTTIAPNVGTSGPVPGAAAKSVESSTAVLLTPPDVLRRIAQHYATGRYREARQLLQSQTVPNEWRAHAALLRAASSFALFHAEGQKDRQLLDEARRAVQACSQAKSDLRPSRRLYAPPFIDFFERHAGSRQTARVQD